MSQDIAQRAEALLGRARDILPDILSMGRQASKSGSGLSKARLFLQNEVDDNQDVRPCILVMFSFAENTAGLITLGRFEHEGPRRPAEQLRSYDLDAPANHLLLKVYQQACAIEDAADAFNEAHPLKDCSFGIEVEADRDEPEFSNMSICDIPVIDSKITRKYDNVLPAFIWSAQELAHACGSNFDLTDCKKYHLKRFVSWKDFENRWGDSSKGIATDITIKAQSEKQAREFLNIGIASLNRAQAGIPLDSPDNPYEVISVKREPPKSKRS
jgi:hypothetical protein